MNFKGFTDETFSFLAGLCENNSKAWFDEHKKTYEKCLKAPLYDLASDVGAYMSQVDPAFETLPARAVARINRDIRFSNDKSPYKTNLWASWTNKTLDESPGFYFEVGIDYYGYGMGFYQNKRETIERFQQRISDNPKRFKEITSFLSEGKLRILGEKYKRSTPPPAGLEDWWGFKSVYVAFQSKELEPVKKPDFSKQLIEEYKKIERLYHFLMDLRGDK